MSMFARPSIADLYRLNLERAKIETMSAPDRLIEETDTEDLVEHFASKYRLTPISIDAGRPQGATYRKRMQLVPAHRREEGYRELGDTQFEYESIRFTVPFIHNEDIHRFAELATSTMSLSWRIDQYEVTPDGITGEFDMKGYGFDYKQADQANRMLEEHKRQISDWIGWVNADIAKENPNLKTQLTAFVNERKAKLEKDKQFIAELNSRSSTPIKIEDSEAARKIKLNTVPLVKKVAPKPSVPPEYELDSQMVLDIIAFMDNQGRQFERTSKSFADHDETAFRNTFLVTLNAIFSEKATGETFSNNGKTDIYLNIDKGNILVFECKIWGGQVLYHATIDQLLGYLMWRHNFGVMVTFVKKKNFSAIIGTVPDIISSHPSYMNSLRKIGETHFASSHYLPQDKTKTVEIHHLFYNLYSD